MALTYQAAVEQTITAGEQIHQIVNGTATTEVTVEDGSKIPTVRKSLLDNFYFKSPLDWQSGQQEVVFNQLRKFTDGTLWYAPTATAATPVGMGATPVGNNNWRVYTSDLISKINSFSGTLTADPSWANIPNHNDPDLSEALNAQAEALTARSELLKVNADRSFVVSGDAGVKYMAHRGLKGVAPENTLPAFEAAGRAGFWGAECDIRLTSDGVWVVIHDDTVDRTTDGTGTVSSKTLAQIKALDAGSKFHPYYAGTRIPTLTEFLKVCRKYRMTPMIEFKQAGATDAQIKSAIDTCIAMIPDLQFCFIGNGEAAVQQIRDVNPNVSVELLAGTYSAAMVDACLRTGCNWLAMQYVTPFPDVSYARTKGINLTVWTVNDPDFTKICLANGVRKITTDFTNLF